MLGFAEKPSINERAPGFWHWPPCTGGGRSDAHRLSGQSLAQYFSVDGQSTHDSSVPLRVDHDIWLCGVGETLLC